MTSTPAKPYLAGGATFLYPSAGDPTPPGGAKVLLLTIGGICVVGTWASYAIAWHPLPKRDRSKEPKTEAPDAP